MSNTRISYCSWCFRKSKHKIRKQHKLTRNIYICKKCRNFTLKCRYCENMTEGKPRDWEERKKKESILKSIKTSWNDELCAEHNGKIASFKMLRTKLDDLEDYKIFFKREKKNLLKGGLYAGFIIGGVVVFAPMAFIAAPGVASALGSAGLLGAASTGTAINTLSGAALTSASLAAVGCGTMSTGIVLLTAAGASLGAIQGGVISNGYFSNVKGFEIKKLKDGKSPALVFINGFLSQKQQTAIDWENAVRKRFSKNACYLVNWESKTLYSLGSLVAKDTTGKLLQSYVKKLAKRAARKASSKINPIKWAAIAADIIANDWHVAMVKAGMTGIILADLLARVGGTKFILMGNSLGCRVIYYALQSLSTKRRKYVKDVYLLGGAIGRKDVKGWKAATKAIKGKIHNCFSENDMVLRCLYKPSTAFISDPIGLGEISYPSRKIKNWDVSELVDGHLQYKQNFGEILEQIQLGY